MAIYIITDADRQAFKIGYTSNPDVRRRLSSLQTGNPRKLLIVGSNPAGSRSHESEVHRQLADHRTDGGSEWFDATSMVVGKLVGKLLRGWLPSGGDDFKHHELPDWFADAIRKRYGLRDQIGADVAFWLLNDWHARSLLDHWGCEADALICEPYDATREQIRLAESVADEVGAALHHTASSRWNPGRTHRYEFRKLSAR